MNMNKTELYDIYIIESMKNNIDIMYNITKLEIDRLKEENKRLKETIAEMKSEI